MPTTGIVNSKLLKVYVGATAITCQTDATLSFNNDTRTTTCKDSGQYSEALYAMSNWEISGTALVAYDSSQGFKELMVLAQAQTVSTVSFKTAVLGDPIYTGDVLWQKVECSSPNTNENVTFSFTALGTGPLTVS
jgi:hypothetical protein